MLFNSYIFIFAFLPVTLAGYFLLGSTPWNRLANVWLIFASLFFYGWWDIRYLPLLLVSILVNYGLSGAILYFRRQGQHTRQRAAFWFGILCNLALLGYYKYMDFLLGAVNDALGTHLPLLNVILPLGISFFTITQILALIDCHEGVAKDHNIIDYALFVSFFPHLMAGPILYHRPMMQQFRNAALRRPQAGNLAMGFSLFILGLAKKLLIADSFIVPADWGFGHAGTVDLVQSWQAVLCYMMQLYFDFSGYSDMAVGLARMMNIEIPINFRHPFHATNVANFWQRWHISLTNAITACVYMPLVRALGKAGRPTFGQTLFAASIAFFLVGIWHGAGWNFVLFAALQSIGIVVCQTWKHYHLTIASWLGRALTLLFVFISFVCFRAPDLPTIQSMFAAMSGAHGICLPALITAELNPFFSTDLPASAGIPGLPFEMLCFAIVLVLFAPDANDIVKKIQQHPRCIYAVLLAGLFMAAVYHMTKESVFLYFQF